MSKKFQVLKSTTSLAAISVVFAMSSAAVAGGLPTGGHFAEGHGSIAKANQSLTVKQSSTTGIINWNSFSIGTRNGVTFDNGSGATLNRITGGNLSTIAGSLHATGSLYLLNSSGVIVSKTGRVVTGGSFAASTNSQNDSSDELRKARIVNRGSIVVSGDVTLSGGTVRSTGSIRASRVDLESSRKVTISGTVTAKQANGEGGTVIVTSKHVDVTGKALISASGSRGGTVLIGGDIHGGAVASDDFVNRNVRNAKTTIIGAGASIRADGTKSAGGDIVIWSNGHTSFEGQISARGPANGGFAEVSSHDLLAFTGRVDLTSAHGTTGTLLLDPENVTIEDETTSNGTLSGGTFTPTGDNSILSVSTLEAALAGADVTVTTGSTGSQHGDITVADAVTWGEHNDDTTTLTLDANGNVNVNASISATSYGALTLKAEHGNININAPIQMYGEVKLTASGDISINGAISAYSTSIAATTGNVSITQPVTSWYNYSHSSITAGGTVTIDAAISGSQTSITTTELSGSGTLDLSNAYNHISTLGTVTGSLYLADASALVISGDLTNGSAGGVVIRTTGTGNDLTIEGLIRGKKVSLYSAGALEESGGGKLSVTHLNASAVGGIALDGPNTITRLGALTNTGSGDISVTDARSLTTEGSVNAGSGNLTLTTTGSGSDLTIRDFLTGAIVNLDSAGKIEEPVSDISISADTLSVSAGKAVSLKAQNMIDTLDDVTTNGHSFAIEDAESLTVNGPVDAGNIRMETIGSVDGIAIDGILTGRVIDLLSAGYLKENGAGIITASTFEGSSDGTTSLLKDNKIAKLGAFTTFGGRFARFALKDEKALTVSGAVNMISANIRIQTGGKHHGIAIDGNLSTTGTVTLESAGDVTENTSTGVIDAGLLNVEAQTGIILEGDNDIAALGTDETDSGPNEINGVH